MTNKHSALEKIERHPGYWVNPTSGIIYWRGTIKGKKIKKSTGTTKIGEARKFMDDFLLNLNGQDLKAKRRKLGITNPALVELWDELIRERGVTRSQNTLSTYKFSWEKKLGLFWGDLHAKDVTQKKIKEFEAWFLDEFPTERFFQVRKHLVMFLNYLHAEGYIEKKLKVQKLDQVVQARSKRKTPFRIYKDREKVALIEAAPTLRAKTCLVMYFHTGMRKMELLSAKWDQIDWTARVMNVWSAKNKKWRKVPLLPVCLKALREWRSQSPTESPYLFPQVRNLQAHISGQLFDKDWIVAKRGAHITGKARVHDIRHTFATKTAKDGWPIAVACKVLDMSADEYIKTYVHIHAEDVSRWLKGSFGV